jgi:hypothetical protein
MARVGEVVWAKMTEELKEVPRRPIELVLVDQTDSANGYAMTLPLNTIVIYVTAPTEDSTLSTYEDWNDAILTHEFTHILHLDSVEGIPQLLRFVVGRIVSVNRMSPGWIIEGQATFQETRHTNAGRGRSTYVDMIKRMTVLEGDFPPLGNLDGYDMTAVAGGRRQPEPTASTTGLGAAFNAGNTALASSLAKAQPADGLGIAVMDARLRLLIPVTALGLPVRLAHGGEGGPLAVGVEEERLAHVAKVVLDHLDRGALAGGQDGQHGRVAGARLVIVDDRGEGGLARLGDGQEAGLGAHQHVAVAARPEALLLTRPGLGIVQVAAGVLEELIEGQRLEGGAAVISHREHKLLRADVGGLV